MNHMVEFIDGKQQRYSKEIVQKCISLKRKGCSYREISKKLKISVAGIKGFSHRKELTQEERNLFLPRIYQDIGTLFMHKIERPPK